MCNFAVPVKRSDSPGVCEHSREPGLGHSATRAGGTHSTHAALGQQYSLQVRRSALKVYCMCSYRSTESTKGFLQN